MLRLCVVGAEGGDDYAKALSRFDALACVYDADVHKAREFASRYGVSYYTSLEEMIASTRLDGLVVTTPAYTHLSIVSSMIEHCKNIFLARPVGGSFKECKEIASMAKKSSRSMLVPGYIERFNPLVNKAKEVVDGRRYGSMLILEVQSGLMGRMINSSLLYDVAIDGIDTALYMLHAYPDTVYAIGSEKAIVITLGFRDGRVACLTSNSIKGFRRMTITMENGIARCDLVRQEIEVEGDGDGGSNNSSSNYLIRMEESEEPISSAIRNFIDAIEGRDKPKVSINDALLIERVADSALLSSRLGSQLYIHIQQDADMI
ncbi:MAG: Gfo/Idh/MocA family oxidoreductase [Candidatus Nitrosocaldus sp.]